MPSSNEHPLPKGTKKSTKSQRSPKPIQRQQKAPNSHHRKTSSSNNFEDFKGALRDELMSIDFADDDMAAG